MIRRYKVGDIFRRRVNEYNYFIDATMYVCMYVIFYFTRGVSSANAGLSESPETQVHKHEIQVVCT